MKEGSTLTFVELINKVDSIQIPILQRDYAQGREEVTEVRRQFLNSIKRTLLDEYSSQPLDLDFIYGNFEGSGPFFFSVLDGQQRLTTLFLLHWYLAVKEGHLRNFQESFLSDSGSKFTYKVRVSASEFFNALAAADDIVLSKGQNSISDLIVDRQWFFLSWQSDPTVKACLTMLDAIHQHLFDCEVSMYERLTDTEQPRIIFQYLNLESFGLSDDLYIKMNARGKPLSDFENFKAWLCSHLEKISAGKRIERKLDQQWTDLFWKISQELDVEFDRLYLRLFNLMAFYQACETVEGGYEALDQTWKTWLQRLRTTSGYIPADDFEMFASFDEENLHRVELVLDYFFMNSANDDALQVFKDAVTSDDYVSQTKFYSCVRFIQTIGSLENWTEEVEEHFSRWNRVTGNLINNHRIDELSPFISSIRGLVELSKHHQGLYEFLAENVLEFGFSKEQREEESRKAKLIISDQSWESLLANYEKHCYLQGKVGFLLDMAIDAEEMVADQINFKKMASKVAILLSDKILRSNDFLLERALLTLDDYLVQDRGNRYSFCIPNRSTYRERSENWLRVVKKKAFKRLVRKVGKDVETSLRKIVANANCGGWRQLVIEHPEAIRYCSRRLIHKKGNQIYLLSKSTFRGYHAELRTFILERHLREMDKEEELSAEISDFGYIEVYGDESAYLWIEWEDEDFYIYYDIEGFTLWDDEEDPNQVEMPVILENLIDEVFPEEALA
ncbi:DUF262 domain-containing protein [Vreelandella rituensis]|uniref:DUF262 domain-containing protein n=1 Tax=Vreelandella rituensis TaxID=2282306 RepID=A0A368TWG5_9GAMM|nr:DUF262 domain-containing protein [Halomonas rituensis]RCV89044.1 DUF262 domain-containing protein [Halomonas rituensis]